MTEFVDAVTSHLVVNEQMVYIDRPLQMVQTAILLFCVAIASAILISLAMRWIKRYD